MRFQIFKTICQAIVILVLLGIPIIQPVVGKRALPALTVPADSVAIDSLLVRISRAAESVSYSGVQMRNTIHAGKSIELRWQVYHWQPERTVIVFLAPEDLRNTTLVLKGQQAKYRGNRHIRKALHYGGPAQLLQNGQIFREIALLRKNYKVHASPGQSFLSRPTISLKVTPRHPDRPALYALVDAESGLLLQVKRLPVGLSNDSLAVINKFLEISYGKSDSTIFIRAWSETKSHKKRRKAKTYPDLATLMTSYDSAVLVPKKIPVGFALLRIQSIQRQKKSFLHFLYGDGLTFVSLFQRKGNIEYPAKKEKKKKVRSQSQLSIIRGERDGISYGIAGELPRAELVEMAESLMPIIRKNNTWRNLLLYIAAIFILIFSFYVLRKREKTHG